LYDFFLTVYRLLDNTSIWRHNGAMQRKPTHRMTIRLTPGDMECIEQLKRDYGLSSTLQAIRLALRLAQLERFPAGMEKKN